MIMLAIDKSLPELRAELDTLRGRHCIGIARKLVEIKRLQTAILKAEVDGGSSRVRAHRRSKHAERQGAMI